MKEKYETFRNQAAKRAEIAEMLTIAQKLTNSGYEYIWFVPENEETRKEVNKE